MFGDEEYNETRPPPVATTPSPRSHRPRSVIADPAWGSIGSVGIVTTVVGRDTGERNEIGALRSLGDAAGADGYRATVASWIRISETIRGTADSKRANCPSGNHFGRQTGRERGRRTPDLSAVMRPERATISNRRDGREPKIPVLSTQSWEPRYTSTTCGSWMTVSGSPSAMTAPSWRTTSRSTSSTSASRPCSITIKVTPSSLSSRT